MFPYSSFKIYHLSFFIASAEAFFGGERVVKFELSRRLPDLRP